MTVGCASGREYTKTCTVCCKKKRAQHMREGMAGLEIWQIGSVWASSTCAVLSRALTVPSFPSQFPPLNKQKDKIDCRSSTQWRILSDLAHPRPRIHVTAYGVLLGCRGFFHKQTQRRGVFFLILRGSWPVPGSSQTQAREQRNFLFFFPGKQNLDCL